MAVILQEAERKTNVIEYTGNDSPNSVPPPFPFPSAAATRKSLSSTRAHTEPPSLHFPHIIRPDSPLERNPLNLVVGCVSLEALLLDVAESRNQLDEIPQSLASNLDGLLVVLAGLENELHGLLDAAQSLDVLLDLEKLGSREGSLTNCPDAAPNAAVLKGNEVSLRLLDDGIRVAKTVLDKPIVGRLIASEKNLIRDAINLREEDFERNSGLSADLKVGNLVVGASHEGVLGSS
jgi:hypothetical protein